MAWGYSQVDGIVPIGSINLGLFAGQTGFTSSAMSRTLGLSLSSAAPAPAVKTPWTPPPKGTAPLADSTRLADAMRKQKFIDESDASLSKTGVPKDHLKLFALYKGISTLQVLADAASKKDALAATLPGLDKRFQDGFAQVMAYAKAFKPEDFTLLTGNKLTKAVSGATVARAPYNFTTRVVAQGDTNTPMAGLAGAAPFTVTVSKGGVQTDVDIDLSLMTQPKTLGNVLGFINTKLQAAGFQTRLVKADVTPPDPDKTDKITPAKQYAVRVEAGGSEAVSFSSSAPSTALYMAGQGGTGGELRKLNADSPAHESVFKADLAAKDARVDVKGTAVDSDGNAYVLSTTNGSFGSDRNQSTSDLMLRKYDSAGNVVWSKLMGSTSATDAMAIKTDSDGNVVIAGQINGRLGTETQAGGKDTVVFKINSAGEEVFAHQLGSALDDGATSLAIGPDDAIYVGGQAKGRMIGASGSIGGADAYVVKFSASGTRAYTRQFGTGTDDRVSAMEVDDNGDLVVAANEGGQAVVRKFSTADGTSAALWTNNLGTLASGDSISGLAIEGNSVYVAGTTSNATLTGGGATVAHAHSGSTDGFVFKMTDGGGTVASNTVTYFGTGTTDRINGLAVSGGRIFVAGETLGTLPGASRTAAGKMNAFAAELDATGAQVWASQYGVADGAGFGRGLAIDEGGASALDVLGLPRGLLSATEARTITAQTTARAGDYFTIQVGTAPERKITIAAGETMTSLVRKLNNVLTVNGKASVARGPGGEQLRIEPREGMPVILKPGAGQLDALAGLGMQPGIYKAAPLDAKPKPYDPKERLVYALDMKASYSLKTKEDAEFARSAMNLAMANIRTAYRELVMTPDERKAAADQKIREAEANAKGRQGGGAVPAYLTAQMKNYASGLSRMQALAQSSGSTSSLF